MDINIEEIFKMTVFDYKDLDQIDIVKEVDLFEQIFDEPPKKEVKVNHDHPEQVTKWFLILLEITQDLNFKKENRETWTKYESL